ncbi:cellulose binding domain-containing protein [Solwaraspora sp. WMMD406]|uniref:cellulose binding domain-containing protein n=1 Tax=Solwaraspora sp. WMMD406 TaxID=3016095 RepID=UPI0024171B64|nr:cellulose binding domain-containing protein [Solwaraspora sp. WMMD406]MDG4763546.1 cellulose binding domain-containing protein [Solwaraspora sp. WMMD406]
MPELHSSHPSRRTAPPQEPGVPASRRRPFRSASLTALAVGVTAILLLPAVPAAAATTTADTTPPTTPGPITVVDISETDVTLTWAASTDDVGVAGYEVAQLQSDYILIKRTPTNEITIDGLYPSVTYQFWAYAYDAAGNRSTSNPSLRLTMPPGDAQPPSTPTGLTATTIGTDSVTLLWTRSTDNVYVAWYEVLRIHPDGTTTPVATAPQHPPTGPTARVGGLQPGTSYTFAVRAHDDAGNASAVSTPLTVVTTPNTASCAVNYQVTNQWPGAFQAQLTIRNLGPTTIDGWTLSWTHSGDERIGQLWGAEPVDLVGPDVTVRNTSWNSRISAGGSTQLGFLGFANGGSPAPTGFRLNGGTCAIAG